MSDSFPHGYALLIGVGAAAQSMWSLSTPVQDTTALRDILVDPGLCGFPDDERHIRLLHDSAATREDIRNGLVWLKAQAKADPESTVVLYFSGHGWLDRSTNQYYLIPYDAERSELIGSALPATEFTQAVRAISAKRLLVILDCCHAEGMATSKSLEESAFIPKRFESQAVPGSIVSGLMQGTGRAVISSSRGTQRSWARPDGILSIFTYHLVEALLGAGNKPEDTQVRLSNIINHLGKAVPEAAHKLHHEQTPFFDTATEDFAVAMLQGGKGLPAGGWESFQPHAAATIHHVVQAIAERSIAIGGDVNNSTIIAGDGNVVQHGKYNLKIDHAEGIAVGDQAHADYHGDNRPETVKTNRGKRIRKPKRLRIDAATLDQVVVRQPLRLAVAVRQLLSPTLDIDDLTLVRSGHLSVDWPKEAPSIHLRIQIGASRCEIRGEDSVSLRLYPGQDSPILYFELIPLEQGTVDILVTIYQIDECLGSVHVRTIAREQVVGNVHMTVNSYNILVFGDYVGKTQAKLAGSGAIAQGQGTLSAGERNVVSGGDAQDNCISTGNGDTITKGTPNHATKNDGTVQNRDVASRLDWAAEPRARAQIANIPGDNADEIARTFGLLMRIVNALPEGSPKDDAREAVQKLAAEARRGEQAEESRALRWFTFLHAASEDVWQVAVTLLANPIAGISESFRNAARKSKAQ